MQTVDISGFGGAYEASCQKMLLNGLRFLEKHPNFDWSAYREYQGVFGLTMATTPESKELDDAVCEGIEPSGAMHSSVIYHLMYISEHGYDRWLTQARKQGREVVEQPSEEELDNIIAVSQAEWRIKLAH